MDPEQQALLERARQADQTALGALYDQFSDKIFSYIYRRIGQVEIAEDLTGQVFMQMLEAIRSGQGWRTSFLSWLYRIAHNLVIDYYRRRAQATLINLDDAAPVRATHGDPVSATETLLNRERLRAALSQLTEEQVQVVTLRFIEERSIAEVAQIMRKTEGAIKALQYRAMLSLRRIMLDQDPARQPPSS